MKKSLILVAFFCGCRCTTPTPVPAADVGTDTNLDDCGKACVNLKLLDCPEGDDNDGGDSCYVVCRHTQTSGLTNLKPSCLSSAKSVEEIRACGTAKCKR